MQRLGFIHDMMDVKVLILYVASRAQYPMTTQEIYEVCYQDDCLSYFDVCTAVPEMVASGHMESPEAEKYVITEKGRETAELTGDSLAFTVKQRAEDAVARFNRQLRRSNFVKSQIVPRENGEFSVIIGLDDEIGNLMTLELAAPDQRQAVRMSRMLEKKAEMIYTLTMAELMEEEENLED